MKAENNLTNYFFRRLIFEEFVVKSNFKDKLFICPSCGFPTLTESKWDVCFLCHWEDDGQYDNEADLKEFDYSHQFFNKFSNLQEYFMELLSEKI